MKIFLSYSSDDRARAEGICLALEAQGHDVFFDREDLQGGEDYNAVIRRAVSEARMLLFLISPASVRRGAYTLTELRFAREKWPHPGDHVLPIMLKPTPLGDVPAYLTSVTIFEPEGNIAAEVAARVARRRRSLSVRRALIGSAVVVLAAVTGIVVWSSGDAEWESSIEATDFVSRYVYPEDAIERSEYVLDPTFDIEAPADSLVYITRFAYGSISDTAAAMSITLRFRNLTAAPLNMDFNHRFFSLDDDQGRKATLLFFCCRSGSELLSTGAEREMHLIFAANPGWSGKETQTRRINFRANGLLPLTVGVCRFRPSPPPPDRDSRRSLIRLETIDRMSSHSMLYLSRADVEAVALDMPTIIRLLETAFAEKGAGRVEMPPKPGIHTGPDAFIHAMPAFIPALHAAGLKWVSGYPANPERGLPYISGLIILNDDGTGLPYCVMDCTWITAYRTGAATALSARYLARPESEVVGIIACGVQGRTNLEALATLFPVRLVYAYDIVRAARQRYAEEMSAKLGIEVIAVDSPREAVVESDIVVTSGPILKQPAPTIEAGWLKPGAFGSAVDFDSYWQPAALAELDHLSTDDHAQFDYYRTVGYFQQTPDPHSDLGELVAGLKTGRQNPAERTLAMNLGLALDDMAVAPEVFRRARDAGRGISLEL